MFKIKRRNKTGLKKQRVRRIASGSIYLSFPERVLYDSGEIRRIATAAATGAILTSALATGRA